MLRGIAASSGIGIGNALLVYDNDLTVLKEVGKDPCLEKCRFREAADIFIDEIKKASDLIEEKAGRDEADILRAQMEIMCDPELGCEVVGILEENHTNLEYAFAVACEKYIKLFSEISDDVLRARAADFMDFRDHVLTILMKKRKMDFTGVPHGSVIVAKDIPPSCAASIDPKCIAGIVTQKGTVYSHIAIIARAMGLPTIVSVNGLFERIRDGDTLVVDGDAGEVVSNPDIFKLSRYRKYYSMLN